MEIAILIIFGILLVLFVLYVLSTMGRRGHRGLPALREHVYAHRGLHSENVPENSLEAFRRAKEAGYGVELDVHLLKDGNLAVFHDGDLERMTGNAGKITDLTTEMLKDFRLNNTDYTIPTFAEVLALFDGSVPMIVELKVVNNCSALCEKVCEMLDEYKGIYCVESFDPRCVRWFRKHRPDLIRGQLTENYFIKRKIVLPWILRFVLKNQILNFLTRPDFVAYRFSDRKTISNYLCRNIWKVQGVTWTLQNQEELEIARKEGWISIFEGFNP